MYGYSEGGNDSFTGSGLAVRDNIFYGDAGGDIAGFAKGGDDTFTTEGGHQVSFYGDAGAVLAGHAQGGDDTALLLGSENFAVGDALIMLANAQGGDDSLTGGTTALTDGVSRLYGDAQVMAGAAQGGDDILLGGHAGQFGRIDNFLWGDAELMSDRAMGGNDVLWAGTASPGFGVRNDMWGDGELRGHAQGGADTFVFRDDGQSTVGTYNVVHDFSQDQSDIISFINVSGVQSFDDLVITRYDTTTVVAAGGDEVSLLNFTGALTAGDFLFA
jgi:hypothetical protein